MYAKCGEKKTCAIPRLSSGGPPASPKTGPLMFLGTSVDNQAWYCLKQAVPSVSHRLRRDELHHETDRAMDDSISGYAAGVSCCVHTETETTKSTKRESTREVKYGYIPQSASVFFFFEKKSWAPRKPSGSRVGVVCSLPWPKPPTKEGGAVRSKAPSGEGVQ